MNLKHFNSPSSLQKYTASLRSSGTPDSTIARKLSAIKSFSDYLKQRQIIAKPPQTLEPEIITPTVTPKYFNKYLIWATIILILLGSAFGIYSQFINNAKKQLAYSTAGNPTVGARILSFQGRLTDSSGNPITSSTGIIFKLYNSGTGGTELYTSATGNSDTVVPDSDGIFNTVIGKSHGDTIPSNVFTENAEVWLEITTDSEVMTPRQQIATVAYAMNAETLQGMPPSASGFKNTVLVVGSSGNIYLGETSPSIISTSGTFGLEGQALLLKASDGSNGNITINPDGSGVIRFVTEGTSPAIGGFIDASNANLATGNLFNAQINNTNQGYNFINFSNYSGGTAVVSRFSVSASGNVNVGASLTTSNIINASLAANQIVLGGGTAPITTLGAGTSNYVLVSGGSGAPAWVASTSVGSTNTYTAGIGMSLSGNTFNLNLGATNVWLAPQTFNNNLYALGNVGIGTTAPTYKLELIGSNSIFRIGDTAGNTLVDITETSAQFNLPTTFTSTGDVNLANDLNFTNATASFIKSASPLYLQAGESFNSSDLTLKTYNNGNVIVDSQKLVIGGTFVYSQGATAGYILQTDVNGVATWVSATGVGIGTTYAFTNGLTNTSNTISLGGTLTTDTRLNIGNTEVLFLKNSNGYVGIGTTSPVNPLDIFYDSTAYTTSAYNTSGLRLGMTTTAGDYNGIRFGSSDGSTEGGIWGVQPSLGYLDITFQGYNRAATVYQEWLRIKNNGNVGIGTTAPKYKLEVTGDAMISTRLGIGSTNSLYTLNVGGTSAMVDSYISGRLGIGAANPLQKVVIGGGNIAVDGSTGNTNGALGYGYQLYNSYFGSSNLPIATMVLANNPTYVHGAGNLVFQTQVSQAAGGLVERMRIDNVGNIGIGTSNPLYTLDIAGSGNLNLTGTIYAAGTSGTSGQVLSSTGTGLQWVNSASVGGTYVFANGLTNTGTFVGLGGTITSNVNLTVGNTSAFFINATSGNVGVGTTNPTAPLTVYSDQNRSSVIVGKGVLNLVSDSSFTAGDVTAITFGDYLNYPFGIIGTKVQNNGSNMFFGTSNTYGGISNTALWINKDGFIGLGNTSPIAQLHVTGTGSSAIAIFEGSGNVGIGTTAPSKKLDIAGDINLTGTIFTAGTSGTSGQILTSTGTGLSWVNASGIGGTYTATNGLTLTSGAFGLGGTLTGNTQIGTSSYLLNFISSNGTRALSIGHSSGFIAIGSTSPLSNLNITGGDGIPSTSKGLFMVDSSNSEQALTIGSYYTTPAAGMWLQATDRRSGVNSVKTLLLQPLGGNVGIATTSPGAALHVVGNIRQQGSAGGTGIVELASSGSGSIINFGTSASPTSYMMMGAYNSVNNIDTKDRDLLIYSTSVGVSNAITYKNATGYLGIGTTNPGNKLDISDGGISVRGSVITPNTTPGLYMGWNGTDSTIESTNKTVGGLPLQIGGYPIKFYNSNLGTEMARFSTSGNLGIGTTSPTQKLSVVGNSIISGNLGLGTTNTTYPLQLQSTSSNWQFVLGNFDNNSTNIRFLANGGLANISAFADGAGNTTTSLILNKDGGNVGIGTTNPSKKLDVAGDINLTGTIFTAGTSGTSGQILTSTGTGLSWVNASGIGGTYTATNGLNLNSGAFGLGGTLTGNTQIGTSSFNISFLGLGNSLGFSQASNGYVGIGTSNPLSALQIGYNNNTISSGIGLGGTAVGIYNSYGSLVLQSTIAGAVAVNSSGLEGYTASNNFQIRLATPNSTTAIFVPNKADTNTGLGWADTDILSLVAGGVNGLNLNSSGYVGIGTTSPGANLEITASAPTFRLTSTATSQANQFSFYENNNSLGAIFQYRGSTNASDPKQLAIGSYISGGNVQIKSGAWVDAMRIDSSGNVGIGTTAPSKALDVSGDINLTGTIFTAGTSGTSGQILTSTGTGLSWVNASGIGGTYTATNGLTLTSGAFGLGGTLTGNTQIGTSDFGLSFIGLGGTQGFYQKSNGYVGIGTTNPVYPFDIKGNTRIDAYNLFFQGGLVHADSSSGTNLWSFSPTETNGSYGYIMYGGSANPRFGIGQNLTANTLTSTLTVRNTTASQKVAELRAATGQTANILEWQDVGGTGLGAINASGYIGIGTTAPTQKLDVNGSVNIGGSLSIGSTFLVTNLNADYLDGLHSSSFLQTGSTGSFITDLTAGVGITITGTGVGRTIATVQDIAVTAQPTFARLGLGSTSALYLLNVGGTTSLNNLFVSGNVGIGTTNPGYSLDVSGTGNIRVGGNVGNGIFAYSSTPNHIWSITRQSAAIDTVLSTYAGYGISVGKTGPDSTSSYNFYINSSGNVGIGTTNPSKKLDIAGDINLTGTIFSNGTSGTSGQVLSSTGTGLQWVSATGLGQTYSADNGLHMTGNVVGLGGSLVEDTRLSIGNTEVLFLKNSNGYVGIGTTNPSAILNVAGGANIDGNMRLRVTADAGNTSRGFIIQPASTINGSNIIETWNSQGGNFEIRNHNTDSDFVSSKIVLTSAVGTPYIALHTNSSERFRIDGSGNVGIGTTNPTVKLFVQGIDGTAALVTFANDNAAVTSQIRGDYSNNYAGYYTGTNGTAGYSFDYNGNLRLGNGGGTTTWMQVNTTNHTVGIGSSRADLGTVPLFITNAGNIGIGTTAPTKTLDVSGDINLTGTIFTAGTSGTSGQILTSTGTGLSWVNASGIGGTYTATNGLTLTSGAFGLGGTLTGNTQIGTSSFHLDFIGLGGTQALHIDETGLISIGTNTTISTAKLRVLSSTIDSVGAVFGNTYNVGGTANGSFGANSRVGVIGSVYYNSPVSLSINPLGQQYASAGLVGLASGTANGALAMGVFGLGQANGLSTGSVYGGQFTSNAAGDLNAADTFYGIYTLGDGRTNTVGVDNVYGSYNKTLGSANDITYAGYFTATGGATNYGIYSAAGINYFNSNVSIGATSSIYTFNVVGNGNFSTTLNIGSSLGVTGNVGIGGTLNLGSSTVVSTGTTALFIDASGNISKRALGAGAFTDGVGTTYTATNGLNLTSGAFGLGGTLTGNTSIGVSSFGLGIGVTGNSLYNLSVGGTTNLNNLITSGNVGIKLSNPHTKLSVADLYGYQIGIDVGVYPSVGRFSYESDGTGYGFSFGKRDLGGTGYSDYMYMKDGGYIGIGTTAPTSKIDVVSSQTANLNWVGSFYNAADNPGKGGLYVKTIRTPNDANILQLDAGTNTRFIVRADGNVGIGTTAPGQKLDINGSVNIGGSLSIGSTFLVTNLNADYLDGLHSSSFLQTGSTGSFITDLTAGIGITITGTGVGRTIATVQDIAVTAQPTFARLGLGSTSALYLLNVGGTTSLNNLFASGNVGIGTTVPVGKLSIKGSGNDQYSYAIHSDNSDGTNLFTIRNNGTVGIGTSTPYANLSVVGTGATASVLTIGEFISNALDTTNNWGQGSAVRLGYGMTTENFDSKITSYYNANFSNGSRLQLQTHNGTSGVWNAGLLIDENSNVGIGTTAPGQKLDINGSLNIGGSLSIGSTFLVTNLNADYLDGLHSSSFLQIGSTGNFITDLTAGIGISISGTGVGRTIATVQDISVTSSPTFAKLGLGSTHALYLLNVGGTANFTNLFASGNVGIGTTTPGVLLHLSSTSAPYIKLENTTAGKDDWEIRGQNDNKFVIYDSTNSKYPLIIDSNTNSRLTIEADSDFVFSTGNVGIGTTAPGQKLDINGSVNIGGSMTLTGSSISTGTTALFVDANGLVTKRALGALAFADTAVGTTYTFTNGLTNTTGSVGLGGTLTGNTQIGTSSFHLDFIGLGGTQSLHIDESGNVGIGNTAPGSQLFVNFSNNNSADSNPLSSATKGITISNQDLTIGSYAPLYFYGGGTGVLTDTSKITSAITSTLKSMGSDRAAGQLDFWTRGSSGTSLTSRMTLDNAGNVGIGTTSPTTRLAIRTQVDDSADSTPDVNIGSYGQGLSVINTGTSANSYVPIYFYNGDQADASRITSAIISRRTSTATTRVPGQLEFWTRVSGGTVLANRMIIDSSGNVGIGTTAPTQKLDVNGSVNIGGSMTLTSSSISTGTTALFVDANGLVTKRALGALAFADTAIGTTYTFTNGLTNTTGSVGLGGTLTGNTQINTSSFSLSFIGLGGTQGLYQSANGYVGIGTATAPQKLSISGGDISVRPSANVSKGLNGIIGFAPTIATYSYIAPNAYMAGYNEGSNWFEGTALTFFTHAGPDTTVGPATEKMRINKDGNIGIGTSAPGQKLDVNGSVNIGGSMTLTGSSISTGTTALFVDANGLVTKRALGALAFADSAIGTTYTFTNGLTNTTGSVGLGGTLTGNTQIGTSSFHLDFIGLGGTQSLHIDESGNVGIGTTNPSNKLEVVGGITADDVTFGSGASPLTLHRDGGGAYHDWQFQIASDMLKFTNTGTALTPMIIYGETTDPRIAITGNATVTGSIGIGTTAPGQKLDVNGSVNIGGSLSIGSTFLVTNLNADYLDGLHSSSFLQTGYTGFDNYRSWTANVGTSNLTIGSTSTLTFAAGAGIQATMVGNTITFTNTGVGTTYSFINGLTNTAGLVGLGGTLTQNTQIGTSSFGFGFVGLGGTQGFYQASNGYVGIGTTAPGSILEIGGASSVISNTSGDITFNSASNNISFSSDNLTNITNATLTGSISIGGTMTLTGSTISTGTTALFVDSNGLVTKRALGDLAFANNSALGWVVNVGTSKATIGTGSSLTFAAGAGLSATLIGNTLTFTNTGVGTTYSFNNGLTNNTNVVSLGGTLIQNTQIGTSSFALSFIGLGGTQGLYQASTGYVGIGTTSPFGSLDVRGSIFTVSSASRYSSFGPGDWTSVGGALFLRTSGTYDLDIGTNNTSAIKILSSGNVGIGTTAPLYKLEVNGSALVTTLGIGATDSAYSLHSTGGARFDTNLSVGTSLTVVGNVGIGGTLNLGSSTVVGTGTTALFIDASGNISKRALGALAFADTAVGTTYSFTNGLTNTSNTVSLGGTLTADVRLNIGNTEVLFIKNSNGYVGVGTTNPQYNLTVSGTTVITGKVGIGTTTSGSYSLNVSGAAFASSYIDSPAFNINGYSSTFTQNYLQLYGANGSKISSTSSGNLTFGIGATNLMYLSNTGSLGIGTTAPGQKLDVNGSVNIGGSMTIAGLGIDVGTTALFVDANGLVTKRSLGAGAFTDGIGTTYTFTNGLTNTTGSVGLGGTLTGNTQIGTSNYSLSIVGLTGTQSLFIGASGYVGIGTTNPGRALDISGRFGSSSLNLGDGTGGFAGLKTIETDGTALAIATNGAERFKVSGSEIKFSNPQTFASNNTYDIGSSGTRARTAYFGTSVFSPLFIGGIETTSSLILRSTFGAGTTGADIIFQTGSNGSTEALRILNNGYVGIGTSAPTQKLDVNGSVNIGGSLSIGSTFLVTNLNADYLDGLHSSSFLQTGSTGSFITDLTAGVGITITGTGVGRTIATVQDIAVTAQPTFARLGLGSTSALYLLNVGGTTSLNNLFVSGNVGIGTTGPTVKLQINGGIRLDRASARYIDIDVDKTVWGGDSAIFSSADGAAYPFNEWGNLTINPRIGRDIVFGTGNASIAPSMTISRGGNVGVGTTAPTQKLDVNGSVNIGGSMTLVGSSISTGTTALFVDANGLVTKRALGDLAFANNSALGWVVNVGTSNATVGTGTSFTFAAGAGLSASLVGNTLTFTNTGVGTTYSFNNGLTNNTNVVSLGGNLTGNTSIGVSSFGLGVGATGNSLYALAVGGTAYLTNLNIGSTILVSNLNADMVDGLHASSFVGIGSTGSFITDLTAGIGITITGTGVGRTIATVQDIAVTAQPTFARLGLGSTSALYLLNVGGTTSLNNLFVSGNVGIGTTNPILTTQINGTLNPPSTSGAPTKGILRLSQTSGNAVLDMGIASLGSYGASWLQAYLSGDASLTGYLLLNPNGGNVGIGTTAPGQKLDVNGSVNIGGSMTLTGSSISTGTTALFVDSNGLVTKRALGAGAFMDGVGTTYTFTNGLTNTTGSVGLGGTLTSNTQIGTSSFSLNIGQGNTQALFISSSGFVGIGNTNPGTLLQISGNAAAPNDLFKVTNTYTGGNASGFFIEAPNLATTDSVSFYIGKAASNYNRGTIRYTHVGDSSTSNRLSFDFYGAVNLFNFLANGNLGIGTTSPTQKLDVNGSVNIGGSLSIGSTFLVTNLNADYLDGLHSSSYLQTGYTGFDNYRSWTANVGATNLTIGSTSTLTFATGSGLSATLIGNTLTFTNTGVGTTYTASAGITLVGNDIRLNLGTSNTWLALQTFTGGIAVGTTGLVTSLNADYLDGLHSSSFLQIGSTGSFITDLTAGIGITITGTGVGRTIATIQDISVTSNPTFAKLGLGSTSASYTLNVVGNGAFTTNLNIGGSITATALPVGVGTSVVYIDASGNFIQGVLPSGTVYSAGAGLSMPTVSSFSLNLGSSNVWTALQTFAGGVGVTGNFSVGGTVSFTNLPIGTGSTVLYINSSGNLVAGTLPVAITYTASNGITLSGTDFKLGGTLTQNTTIGTSSFSLNIGQGNTQSLYISSSGLVGMGTTAPASNLEIAKARTGDDTLLILGVSGTGVNNDLVRMSFKLPGSGGVQRTAAQIVGLAESASGFNGALSFYTTTSNTTTTEKMRISSGGLVGIGTTAPGYLLTVQDLSNSNVAVFTQSSGITAVATVNAIVGINNDNTTSGNYSFIGFQQNNTGLARMGSKNINSTNGDFVFQVRNSGNYIDTMYIKSGGNIGIGTTAPGQKLDINGSLNIGGSLSIGSTFLVTNLNADMVDGLHASALNYQNWVANVGTSNLTIGSTSTLTFAAGSGLSATLIGNTLTFTNTSTGTTYSTTNGLSAISANVFGLGGTLTQDTQIGTSSFGLSFIGLGGTQSLYLASNGYVGIGLSVGMSAPLHIGTTTADQLSGYFKGYVAAQKFIDLDNYANYYLDLANASDTSASLSLERSGSIRFNASYSNVGTTGWQYLQNGPAIKIQSVYDGTNGGLFLGVATIGSSATGIGTSWDSGLFISGKSGTTGYVGIGTTAPGQKLDVNGSVNIGGSMTLVGSSISTGTTALFVDSNGLITKRALGAGAFMDGIGTTYSADNGLHLTGNVIGLGGTLTSNVNLTIGNTSAFFINATSGYVGIGTTNPTSIFEVGGPSSTISNTSGDLTFAAASGNFNFSNDNITNAGSGYFSGSVGIGNSSPGLFKLNVGGTATFVDLFTTGKVSIGTSAPGAYSLNVGTTSRFVSIFTTGIVGINTTNPSYGVFQVNNKDAGGTGAIVMIDSTGNLGLGTTNPAYKLTINNGNGYVSSNSAASATFSLQNTTIGASGFWTLAARNDKTFGIYNQNLGADVIGMNALGNISMGGTIPITHKLNVVGSAGLTTGTAWTNTSDVRLKTVESNLSGSSLDKLMALRPISFRWNSLHNQKFGSTADKLNLGFIAQEVETVLPDMITTDSEGYKWYNPSGFEALLTAGVQELNNKLSDITITAEGQINVGYNVSPEVLASLGYDGTKNEIETASYQLNDQFGNPVTRLAQFAQVSVAKLTAGLIKTTNLIADNIIANRTISNEIKTTTITPLDQITDTIVINGNIKAKDASFSSVYADQIINKDGNITDVMAQKIADLRNEITSLMATQPVATPSAIALAAATWETSYATASATLNVDNISITNDLIVGANLIVNGQTNLSKLYVTDTLAVGQMAIKDNIIETTASLLLIQPSGVGSVNILNSRLIVSDDGNIIINGKITANEATFSGSLVANLLKTPNLEADVATIGKINIATDSANSLIVAIGTSTPEATSSASISTNATAGNVTLSAGTTAFTVINPKLSTNSMIYLTPNGSTQNQVVYIKSKNVGATDVIASDSAATPSNFVIGLDNPLTSDVNINWWIIN